MPRVVLVVLDSVGVGELPDAAKYGDEGAFTLAHVKEYAERNLGGLKIDNLRNMGLYNIDGLGNRVASMIFGPEKVVLFVGRNKLCETVAVAEDRLKNVAAPMNAMRLNLPTPCTKTGKCMDCKSPARICSVRVLTERCKPAERIHVLLINQDLGF